MRGNWRSAAGLPPIVGGTRIRLRNGPLLPVFVAKLQHEVGKLVEAKHPLLPRTKGWIVSAQAADRRPLFFWGSTRGGGPRLGWRRPDRKRIPRLRKLG